MKETLCQITEIENANLSGRKPMVSDLNVEGCKPIQNPKTKTDMTMVKLNHMPFEKTFNSLFEDLFQNLPNNLAGNDWNRSNGLVPVNITEGPEGYRLDVVAPGMEKSDFKVNLEKYILTVSAEKKTEAKTENEKQVRREFSFRSFSRSFKVDDSIDTAKIEARYENGILHLSLPKREEVKLLPKEICVN